MDPNDAFIRQSLVVTKPMLADNTPMSPAKLERVQWPALCSPKLDGIRCLMHPDLGPVSRSFKPIANKYIRACLQEDMERHPGARFDGELMALDESGDILDYNDTQSAIMSYGGEPRFVLAVFDSLIHDQWFTDRLAYAHRAVDILRSQGNYQYTKVAHEMLFSAEEFLEFFDKCVKQGYEGAMIRDPQGPYKSGRSTFNQGWLLKYKGEKEDAEGVVTGFEEQLANENVAETDLLGYAKRSSRKEGMVGKNTLGALILDTEWGVLRVGIGVGLDDTRRKEIWDNQKKYLGQTATFQYQRAGMKNKPRFPQFKGFRHEDDQL